MRAHVAFPIATFVLLCAVADAAGPRHTEIAIRGGDFLINGEPTEKGRTWHGQRIEGLLPNARLVQGIFDDANPATRGRWAYLDTGQWDPERNTSEFVAAMPAWRAHGLLAFTLNLQGGNPLGYGGKQTWINTAFNSDGSLRPAYLARASRIMDRADELGMVVNLGLYYFGQDRHLADEAAVRRGVRNAVDWVLDRGYTNVVIEIDNECNGGYHHPILKEDRVPELIDLAKSLERGGRRLLCSVSCTGGRVPSPAIIGTADFVLLHGNGVKDPARITEMVRAVCGQMGAAPKPVLFNEDDHFGFDQRANNFVAATAAHASWGFFDYRMKGEPFTSGFQSVPTDWRIDSPRKRAFFDLLAEITGSATHPAPAGRPSL